MVLGMIVNVAMLIMFLFSVLDNDLQPSTRVGLQFFTVVGILVTIALFGGLTLYYALKIYPIILQ